MLESVEGKEIGDQVLELDLDNFKGLDEKDDESTPGVPSLMAEQWRILPFERMCRINSFVVTLLTSILISTHAC